MIHDLILDRQGCSLEYLLCGCFFHILTIQSLHIVYDTSLEKILVEGAFLDCFGCSCDSLLCLFLLDRGLGSLLLNSLLIISFLNSLFRCRLLRLCGSFLLLRIFSYFNRTFLL